MTTASILPGSRITLNFAIRFTDGQEVDSTFDKEPAQFRLGDGNMLPGFEEFLLGRDSGGIFVCFVNVCFA